MSPESMLLLGAGTIFATVVALCFAVGLLGVSDRAVKRRLRGTVLSKPEADGGSAVRIQTSGTKAGIGRFLVARSSVTKIERNLMLAGRPDGLSVAKIVGIKVAGLAIGLLLLVAMVASHSTLLSWAVGLGAMFFGYFAPDVLALNRAEARQASIQRELPDVLDQVTISIESGLGFEAAFAHIGERRTGPLAEEIVRTVQDMRLGVSRRDAYQALADRTNVEDLDRFVRSVTQADQYGVSISTVVRTQAEEIRLSRRKRAEAAALKVPVKIVFPLLICILPVLFIVILTPAVMSLAEYL
ncbi:MAG: type II secretion system F family protein [Aeromicrobium sp.]